MTNKPESAAVEAVAWPDYLMIRDTGLHDDMGGLGQRIYTTAGAGYKKEKYVRASALDALRGEVERLRSHSERLSHELSEMAQVCGEAYQVVGILLDETEQFGSNHGDKILTNLWEGKLIHKDVIPWSFKGNRHG